MALWNYQKKKKRHPELMSVNVKRSCRCCISNLKCHISISELEVLKNAANSCIKVTLAMWFNVTKRAENPPGSQTDNLTGGKESYECTIQCEVKNILYAFLSSCVHFSCCCFSCFYFILESTKKLKLCAGGEKSAGSGGPV